jgi:dTDP-glucose pyrophosphorylase
MKIETDLSPLTVLESASLRDVMARLNQTPYLVQLVLNSEGVLTGTATDGDLRRGLLNDNNLGDPISCCVHRDPVTALTTEEAAKLLSENASHLSFVPVIDRSGRPTHVVMDAPGDVTVDTALVMVGGYGKRLGDLTKDTPKPLLAINGEPILSYLLSELDAVGISKVYLAAHYLSDKIEDYVAQSSWADKTEVVVENQPMGTAGVLGMLKAELDGTLLVLNGDVLTRTDYSAMLLHHQAGNWDLTVGGAVFEKEIPYGVIEHENNGAITNIVEKPVSNHLVAAGIYLIEPKIYTRVEEHVRLDMPDLIQRSIENGLNIGVFPIHEYWRDLGAPSSLQSAAKDIEEWL